MKINKRYKLRLFDKAILSSKNIFDILQHAIIHFDQQIDEKILLKAAKLLFKKELILGCKLKVNKKESCWVYRDNFEEASFFEHIEATQPNTVDSNIKRIFKVNLNPEFDPLIKLTLIRFQADSLILSMNHSIADGKGLIETLYLLCSLYNSIIENPDYLPVENTVDNRSAKKILSSINFFNLCKIGCRTIFDLLIRIRRTGIPVEKGNYANRAFKIYTVDQLSFSKIKSLIKSKQVTLNDFMLTVLYRALIQTFGKIDRKYRPSLSVNVDLRRYYKNNESGNLFNLSFFETISPNCAGSFESDLIKIKKIMNKKKKNFIGLSKIPLMALFFSLVPFYKLWKAPVKSKNKSVSFPPFITNVGKIIPAKLIFNKNKPTNVLIFPSVFYDRLLFLFSSYENFFDIIVSYCDSGKNEQYIKSICKNIDNEINGVLNSN